MNNLIAIPANMDTDNAIDVELPEGFEPLGFRASYVYCHGWMESRNIWDIANLYQKGEVFPQTKGIYPITLYYINGDVSEGKLLFTGEKFGQRGLIVDNNDIQGMKEALNWYNG